ncbi:MAG: universal stress protein [Anaerolineales bacterium]|nr:universal stress protein [Anaerolineales bacterium]MCB8990053.1 universal stress protein [Ardenticatenaceae bacterium]MCB9005636.1 universal stress protein [Ardenticatenaceae bacterium]
MTALTSDYTRQVVPEGRNHGTAVSTPHTSLACVQMSETLVTLLPFATYLAGSLGDTLTTYDWTGMAAADWPQRLEALTAKHELLVLGEPEPSFLARLLGRQPGCKAALQVSLPTLIVRQPRWPLERILLVVRADGRDGTAVSWAARLATASHAAVTLLAAVPSLPLMYGPHHHIRAGLDVLLTATTNAGGQLRTLARHVADCQIDGSLRLRRGEPAQQIRWEVAESNPDLIVLVADACSRWPHWLLDDLTLSLLRWIDRPVLITR